MFIVFYAVAVLTVVLGYQSGSRALLITSYFGGVAIAVVATWYRQSTLATKRRKTLAANKQATPEPTSPRPLAAS
jgi:hypothetical protein